MQRRSETLETLIDNETQAIIDAAYQSARQILSEHRSELEAMSACCWKKRKSTERIFSGSWGRAGHRKRYYGQDSPGWPQRGSTGCHSR
jgi:hypothetical protein